MFRFVFMLATLMLALLAAPLQAQEVKEGDVPELAIWESLRRGAMVQELGTTTAGEIDIIADALAPPEDDSHKWFVTLVTQDKCESCELLKAAFIKKEELRAWVNVDEPAKSTTHYQVRRVEDVTQKDWLKGLQPEIQKGGFPLLVIQPPRNGEFGPNKTVVAVLHTFDGDCAKYSQRMRDAITAYVREMSRRGLITHIGDNQRRAAKPSSGAKGITGGAKEEIESKLKGGAAQDTGAPPPFSIPPNRVNPFAPSGPVDFPPSNVSRAFTPEQIKMMIPNAPPEFVLQAVAQQVGDAQTLLMLWQAYGGGQPANPTNPAPTNWLSLIQLLLSGGNVIGLIVVALTILKRVSNNPKVDATAERILRIVQQWEGNAK